MRKQILSIILTLCMVLSLLPATAFAADIVDSGECGADGDNVTWTLDSEGILTFTGEGMMLDYGPDDNEAPWISDSVKEVVIEPGVTSIGFMAFRGCFSLTSVSIPNSVTSIGDYAFDGCSSLTGVAIPESVERIAEGAFRDCGNMTSVTISDGVKSIENYTFFGCRSLTDVTMGNGVTSIGREAFYYCISLEDVTIGSSVTSIGIDAFSNCDSLKIVRIPTTVTRISGSAFGDCPALTDVYYGGTEYQWDDIVVEAGSEALIGATIHYTESSEEPEVVDSGECGADGDNVTWTLDSEGLLTISGTGAMQDYDPFNSPHHTNTKIKSVVIQPGVTSIGSNVFYNCSRLASITIPDSVTIIGEGAFDGCRITSIDVSSENPNYSSADALLFNKAKTELVFYGNGRKDSSFQIPDGVTTIGDRAFYDCRQLTSILIPDGVTIIGYRAFDSCTGLTSITIPDGVTTIGDSAFDYCVSLASVTIPNSVTTIGERAFVNCSALKSVTIPGSVTTIGEEAFCNCNLTNIDVSSENPNYSSVDGVLFDKAKAELIQYPQGNPATLYQIPDGVTSIGYAAFDSCDNLMSVTIPTSATSIGDNAFYYCDGLTSITIPDSVTSIGHYVFAYCNSLADVTLPTGVTNIDYGVFYHCTSLSSIIIPDSVKSLEWGVFKGCSALTSVTIPTSVRSIGCGAFEQCDALGDVYYSGSRAQWTKISIDELNEPLTNATIHFGAEDPVTVVDSGEADGLSWTLTEDGTLTISGEGEMTESLIEQWNDHKSLVKSVVIQPGVTSIGESAFYDCGNLTCVDIPDSVTAIGNFAFYFCSSLTDVTLPESVTSIGVLAFGYCSSLTSLTLPKNVTNIISPIFRDCAKLESVEVDENNPSFKSEQGVLFSKDGTELVCYPGARTGAYQIPDGVVTIGDDSFYGCTGLTDVTIPDSVTTIGSCAFYGCTGLTEVTIPEGVTSIKDGAFHSCTGLTDVAIPGSVESIGEVAFHSCALTSVTVPEGVTTIGQMAFGYCKELRSVSLPSTLTSMGESIFYFCYNLQSVEIPAGVDRIGYMAFNTCSSLESVTIPVSVKNIDYLAFGDCNRLTDVYYLGTEAQWNAITIAAANAPLENAAIHFSNLKITAQPANVSATAGNTVTMTVKARGAGLTYQWQYQVPGGSWKNTTLSGNKTATLKITATVGRSGYQYRCVIKDASGAELISNAAKLTVLGVKTQPKAVSTTAGKTATFKVAATGSDLTYQWQYKTPSGSWKNTTLAGNKTDTLKVGATCGRSGYQYRCAVKSGSNTVYSDGALLTVFGIKTQPAHVTGTVGKNVSMKVVATGENLTYQWQYKTDAGTWKNTTLTGAKTATLKIPVTLARDGNVYRCVVKSGSNTVTSDGAKLTVFAIKTQPKDVTATAGKTVTMKVVATGENLTYQWQYQAADGTWKNTTLTGAKTATLSIPATAARNGNVYRCIVKSGTSTITSNAAKLTVK